MPDKSLPHIIIFVNKISDHMPFLELFDETLDINMTQNYELSIQMSPDGLVFSILDNIRNKYVLLRSFEPDNNKYFTVDEIRDIIGKDDFLTKTYKKVSIIMPSPKVTLIPAPLYDPGRKEEYFELNLIKDDNETVVANKIAEPDSFAIFSVSKPLFELSGQFYPAVSPFHHIKPLLSQISHYSKSEHGTYTHIHIEREYFNMLILDQNMLKFSNTFTYRNISDILYYVLNVIKNYGDSNDKTIHFSGLTGKYDDLYSNFAIYIKDLKFTGPTGNYSFSYVFNEVELHRYINLFSVTNCE